MAKPKLLKIFNKTHEEYGSDMIIGYPRITTNIAVTIDDANKHIVASNKFFIHDGALVSFVAPADSTNVTHLKLTCHTVEGDNTSPTNDVLYELVDASLINISKIEGVFVSGAAVNVRLDEVNKRAFIENAAATPSFVFDGKGYTFVYDEEVGAVGIKSI